MNLLRPALAAILLALINAGVLLLTAVSHTFTRNGKPNRVAEHDVGLAAANLTVQAMHLGLHVHQMAGINQSVARQSYSIPDAHDPFTAIAIGYAAAPRKATNEDLAKRDKGERSRKPLGEIVYAGQWGQAAGL